MKNWIAVASAEHARRGRDAQLAPQLQAGLWPADQGAGAGRRAGPPQARPAPLGGSALHEVKSVGAYICGYMQVCHGKLAPIRRVQPGDRVAYYAPTVTMGGKDSCQSFVSIGIIQSGQPYAFDMGSGFVPYRRDVAYVPAQEASILPLLDTFEFVENRQRWGYKFRFGLFDVSEHDMRLIAGAMAADFTLLHFQ